MEKAATAPMPTLKQTFREALTSPAVLGALASPLAVLGIERVDEWRRGRRAAQAKATAYKEMLALHPHFKQRDPEAVSRVYNSLHNVSPVLARDPLVAGAWVDNVIDNRSGGLQSYQALLSHVGDMASAQRSLADGARAPSSPLVRELSKLVTDVGSNVQKGMDNSFARRKREAEVEQERRYVAAKDELVNLRHQADQRINAMHELENELLQKVKGAAATLHAKHAAPLTELGQLLLALQV